MSTDDATKDSGYPAEYLSSRASRAELSRSEMDLPGIRFSTQSQVNEPILDATCMSIMALRAPMLPSPRDVMPWEDRRPLDLPSGPRWQADRIELPSIRQAIPEIQMRASWAESEYRMDSDAQSPTIRPRTAARVTEYSQSPLHKRRRLSVDDENDLESRDAVVQKLSRSPIRSGQRSFSATVSPTSSTRRASTFSATESRSGSNRTSPYVPPKDFPTMRSPPFDSSSITRSEWRPTLPSLPIMPFERGTPTPRGHSSFAEYSFDPARSGSHTFPQLSTAFEPPMSFHQTGFSYGYQQPRGQSYPGPSSGERTPLSANSHHYLGVNFPYGLEINNSTHDSKQRKRRGNLPKETTDKLRAWFVAHLQHPYPTEDEKQDLMRQTGLQMNQISNWFINARRRQLPAMINNARAESDARSARGGEGHVPSERTSDYGDEREERSSVPLGESDDGGSVYEEEHPDPRLRRELPGINKTGSF